MLAKHCMAQPKIPPGVLLRCWRCASGYCVATEAERRVVVLGVTAKRDSSVIQRVVPAAVLLLLTTKQDLLVAEAEQQLIAVPAAATARQDPASCHRAVAAMNQLCPEHLCCLSLG